MKKIILSATVAAMALTTAASALEDIKVNGSAKLWYETNNGGDNGMFNKETGNGEFTIKLDMTGKQGNIGFGVTAYDSSTLGLANQLVAGSRSEGNVADGGLFLGQAYITAPLGAKTLLKIGKQELQTPLAFTEKWASVNNAYNAAVVVNNSLANTTIIGAYVGQTNGRSFSGNQQNFTSGLAIGNAGLATGTDAFALAALYKNNNVAVNGWAYSLTGLADALWIDASTKVAGVGVKGYAATVMPNASGLDDTIALAASASTKVNGVSLFAAGSKVNSKGVAHVGNYGTGGKKTKLPTMGVYTDGAYVAQPGALAFKVKAAGKAGGMGVALQAVLNQNDKTDQDMMEIDLILAKKLGDFNVKAILMHRDGEGAALAVQDEAQQHVRVVTSVKF